MSTKRILILTAAFSLVAHGAAAGGFVATGKVIQSTPIVETVLEPVEECRQELRRVGRAGASSNDRSNRIIGGILGGAAGSAFGKGSGKDAAAAAGAVLGSEVGAQDGGLSGGELVGGAAGGIIGNQIGSGSGKTAATAAGALLGALIGDELENGPERRRQADSGEYRKVRVCTSVERQTRVITGYTVVYEYAGRQFTGVLSYRPGATVDIEVNAHLLENRASRAGSGN